MSRFKELNDNLIQILVKMTENQKLCKLLKYNSYTPLSEPDISDTTELLFSKIYPYPFTPEIQTDTTSIINVMFDGFSLSRKNPSFKTSSLTFLILCHSSLWRIEGVLRPIAIMQEIDEMFNSVNGLGVGKLSFESSNLAWVGDKYSGYRVTYKVYDFN